jgi:hypothetical protein
MAVEMTMRGNFKMHLAFSMKQQVLQHWKAMPLVGWLEVK